MKTTTLTSIASLVILASSVCSSFGQSSKPSLLKIYDQLQNHETRINKLEQRTPVKASGTVKNVSEELTKGAGSYRVQSGDTIAGISRDFHVSRSSLLVANNLNEWSVIHPGQILKVPKAAATAGTTNVVRNQEPVRDSHETLSRRVGENTLFSLARDYNTSVEAIKAMNPGLDELRLRPDQMIRIPVSKNRPVYQPVVSTTKKTAVTVNPMFKDSAPQAKISTVVKQKSKGIAANELHPKSAPAHHEAEPKALEIEPRHIAPPAPVTQVPAAKHQSSSPVIEYPTSEGDTWESVAQRFGTTANDLRQRNGSVAGVALSGGITLQVPAHRYAQEADMN